MSRKFVVTGCSRSGTKYAAKLLTALGIRCRHERIFGITRVRGLERASELLELFEDYQGDSSFLAAPFLNTLPAEFAVLHQVRHPMEVIRSHRGIRFFAEPYQPSLWLADNHPEFLAFVGKHCPPVLSEQDETKRCMRYWVGWNRKVEEAPRSAEWRYKRYSVEDLNEDLLEEVLDILEVTRSREEISAALAAVSRQTNSRERDESLTWPALPEGPEKEAVARLAAEYGYALPQGGGGDPSERSA